MSLPEVEQAALKLSAASRAALVQKLLLSLEPDQSPATLIPDWVGLGSSDAALSLNDEQILKAEWQ